MRHPALTAICAGGLAALVGLAGGCNYPDFGFAPGGETAAVEDSDLTADTDLDTAPPAVDGALDASAQDTATTALDAGVDAKMHDAKLADTAMPDAKIADTLVATDSTADALAGCALIDDLEDGDKWIRKACGRNGYWYTFNDGTAGGTQTPKPGLFTPTPIPGGRAGSSLAARTVGSGFTSWGADIGLAFTDSGYYDAHAWSGVAFWARVGGATAAMLRVDVPDIDTDLQGGKCGGTAKGCYDHFGLTLAVDTTWKYFVLSFADMKQQGWGNPAPTTNIDTAKIYSLQVLCGTSFDVWIDDVTFVP